MSSVEPVTIGTSPTLTAKQFKAIRDIVYRISGIDLRAGKEGLVQSRLSKRLRKLGLTGFDAYIDVIAANRQELSDMVDALTTNKTSFFREAQHLNYLGTQILPPLLRQRRPVRIWSAGCSSGEEPYSIGMVARRVAGGDRADVRVLATDLSAAILARARAAIYDDRQLEGLTPDMLREFFDKVRAPDGGTRYRVQEQVRSMVRFARLNLMETWPMRGPFDAIFCRNVMIYFDKPTQERLVERFTALLAPEGHLFVGHSESLTGSRNTLRYVQPAAYRKCQG